MPKKSKQKFPFRKIITILIIVGLLWYFRPWFHEFLMIFYVNPIIIEIFIIWLVIHKLLFSSGKPIIKLSVISGEQSEEIGIDMKTLLSFSLLFVLLMFGMIFTVIIPKVHIANEINYNKITKLPETKQNIRLMPYEVAYRYSKDSLQLSQFKLGTGNIALVGKNRTLSWMFPLIPDGFILQFILKNKGIVFVDATTQEKNSRMVWHDLEIGEGMQITDNLYWNIYKKKYWIDVDDPYYLVHDNDIYTVVSVISYSFHNWLGLLYTVPRFEGVFLIKSNGETIFLTPEEAAKNEILHRNRIFPEKLARFYVESYALKKGVINYFFIHEDQIDIQDVSARNRQPFLMDTEDGLKWFISTEPYGESHGIFKIFMVDAITGKIDMYELPEDETLTGPIKARDFVRRSNPIVDWTRFIMVEPLPFITNDTLYWKIVVIPGDAAGIAYQAFVNSRTNEVTELEDEDKIREFVQFGRIKTEEEITTDLTEKESIVKEIKKKLTEIEKLLKKLE
jgi:hypothetical protein